MPWNETDPMDQRCKFVVAYSSGQFEMAELCKLFGVSRPTGYKWVRRYQGEGAIGLKERSRAAHRCPHRMSEAVAQWMIGDRKAHPQWGPRKILKRYKDSHPHQRAASRSAIAALFRREGLSKPRRRRRRSRGGQDRVGRVLQPNQVWTIDFKGQFRTTDHRWCYPLTVMDGATRYLLEVHAHSRISSLDVQRRMRWLFEQYGLPEAIHSDNGVPFASSGFTGLSRLSVYWLKLGIRLQRSRPGCPQDNAAHERMHRTLKAHTTRPPGCNLRAQQHRFDHFRAEYNRERPHESLSDRTPAEFYRHSARAYPRHLPEPHYPGHFHVRRVRTDGSIKWLGHLHFTSTALCGEWVALEEVDEGVCSVWFMNYLLGRLDARSMTFTYVPV